MRIPARMRQHGAPFNLTPMIDIVFLLIIFFLVASYLSSSENHATVQLPQAVGGSFQNPETPRRIVVTVEAANRYAINGDAVTVAEFAKQIAPDASRQNAGAARQMEVRLRVDRRVPYETVEPLLIECARAGISRIQFHVLPAEG